MIRIAIRPALLVELMGRSSKRPVVVLVDAPQTPFPLSRFSRVSTPPLSRIMASRSRKSECTSTVAGRQRLVITRYNSYDVGGIRRLGGSLLRLSNRQD